MAREERVQPRAGAPRDQAHRLGAAPREWDLALARNEVEACQLVLAADRPVKGVTVGVSFADDAGARSGLAPSLFKVEYVSLKKQKAPFPDPLPPLAGAFDLEPGRAQPVWITIRAPKDAVPGTYRATVKVQAGAWSRELPLRVRVWGFTLPDTPACVTAFGNDPNTVAEWHGVAPGSRESAQTAEILVDRLGVRT